MTDFFLHCFRLGYVLLFSFCAQVQMSHVGAVEGCGKRRSGVRLQASDMGVFLVADLSPLRGSLISGSQPTDCAVGFILMPLRGSCYVASLQVAPFVE